jgi:hypothetical protein
VSRPFVPAALQEVDKPEGGAQITRAEPQILVVLDAGLAVEVDVVELARPQCLGDSVREVQARHLLVADFGVDAIQLGPLQPFDEGEGVTNGGEQDVAAWLVRLGLDGEAQVVPLGGDVFAQQVEGLLHAVECVSHVLRPAGLGAFPAAPGNVRRSSEVDRQVDVADHLADGIPAHVSVVGREAAVLEDGVGEQVRGGHRDHHAGGVERLPEALDVRLALGLRGTERDQVVVVERHAPGAELGQTLHGLDGVKHRTGGVTERVTTLPADGPQTESELVLGGGLETHDTAPRR